MLGARGGDTDQIAASSSALSFSCALERSSAWRSPAISARISSGESEPASCTCGGGWGSGYGDGYGSGLWIWRRLGFGVRKRIKT